MINDFVKDVTGIEFIKVPIDKKFKTMCELKEAHEAIINIINDRRKPSISELINMYPLLEISAQWSALKNNGKISKVFLEHCRQKFETHSDFYGTGFEIDMASRGLLSGWDIKFPENGIKKEGIKPIDFIFPMKEMPADITFIFRA